MRSRIEVEKRLRSSGSLYLLFTANVLFPTPSFGRLTKNYFPLKGLNKLAKKLGKLLILKDLMIYGVNEFLD
ncbi:hypothetical protein AY600_12630 [Phormidium willei BDU 130791]|nr:hypothetical protein AY600_12630 [Phormidium willei BDU 130791]